LTCQNAGVDIETVLPMFAPMCLFHKSMGIFFFFSLYGLLDVSMGSRIFFWTFMPPTNLQLPLHGFQAGFKLFFFFSLNGGRFFWMEFLLAWKLVKRTAVNICIRLRFVCCVLFLLHLFLSLCIIQYVQYEMVVIIVIPRQVLETKTSNFVFFVFQVQ